MGDAAAGGDVWTPRGTPPQVATRAALRGIDDALALAEFTPPQRHLVRAMHSRLSLVCVAPLGAGKWTAACACAALGAGSAVWALPAAAVAHSRRALLSGGHTAAAAAVVSHEQVTTGEIWASGSRPATVILSDWHLAAQPTDVLDRAQASAPQSTVWLVTSEEDRRARSWATTIARGGRCGFVSTVPYSQTRWRLIAPWRGAMIAPAEATALVTEELMRTVRDGCRTRFALTSAADGPSLIARVLDDERMSHVSATLHPSDDGAAAVVFWNDEPEAALPVPDGEREVIWLGAHDDVEGALREATATGDTFKGACAGAFVCRDAADILLASVVAEQARRSGGARTPEDLWARVREVSLQLTETLAQDPSGKRLVYEAVALLQMNRGAAAGLAQWLLAASVLGVSAGAAEAFAVENRAVVRRWAGVSDNTAWARARGWEVWACDAFGLGVNATLEELTASGVPRAAPDPVLAARLTGAIGG